MESDWLNTGWVLKRIKICCLWKERNFVLSCLGWGSIFKSLLIAEGVTKCRGNNYEIGILSLLCPVLQNSVYCMSYINNNLHLTNWKRKQECLVNPLISSPFLYQISCSDLILHDYCRSVSKISENFFFPR